MGGRRLAAASGASSDSGHAFLYARCFVVAQGEAHYSRVVADSSLISKSDAEWCEALIMVGPSALECAMGAPGEIETSVSYETGSNRAPSD